MIRETQKKWLSSKSLLCCVRGLSVGQRTSAAVRSATVTRHSWSAGWRWTNCTVCLFQTVCVQRRKLNLQRVVDNELVPIILIMESFFLRELWNLCWYQLLRCKGLTHQATSQRQDRLWASAALVVAVCPAHVSDNQCLERALERPCSVLWKLLSGTHFLDLACCVAHTACLTETSTDSCFFYNVSLCKNIFFGRRASRDVVIPQFGQYWSLLSCLALSRGARYFSPLPLYQGHLQHLIIYSWSVVAILAKVKVKSENDCKRYVIMTTVYPQSWQATATCWYGGLFPLMQLQNVRARLSGCRLCGAFKCCETGNILYGNTTVDLHSL